MNPITKLRSVPPKIRIGIYATITTVFGVIGGGLLNSTPKPAGIAWSFLYIACVFAICAGRLAWLNHKSAHPVDPDMVNLVAVALIILASGGCFFAILQEKHTDFGPEPPKPLVELHFAIADVKGIPLELTDDVFKFRRPTGNKFIIPDQDVKGVVVVSVLPGTSNVNVELGLVNNSPSDVKNLGVKLTVPTASLHSISPLWIGDSRDDSGPSRSSFEVLFEKLPIGSSQPLPNMDLFTHGLYTTIVEILPLAPPMDPVAREFRIFFLETNRPAKPYITLDVITPMGDGYKESVLLQPPKSLK